MGEWANLIWNPYRWRPVEGYYFFTIPLSSWRTPLSMVPHAWVERWRNGKDILWGITSFTSLHARKLPLMWPLWHKAILVNKRRACIARVFISKQYIFCLPNTSELVKHEFWDWIQAWTAWWQTTFIMLELCEVKTNNYDSFNWKQALFGERIPNKIAKKIMIWHLFRGMTLWTIWVEHNDKVFYQECWHESQINYSFGMTPSCTMRWFGQGWWNMLRLAFLDQSSP